MCKQEHEAQIQFLLQEATWNFMLLLRFRKPGTALAASWMPPPMLGVFITFVFQLILIFDFDFFFKSKEILKSRKFPVTRNWNEKQDDLKRTALGHLGDSVG